MSLTSWIEALVITFALATMAWGIQHFEPAIVNGVRLFNGFAILTILAWVVRRDYLVDRKLDSHRDEIMHVFETRRREEYEVLLRQTAEVAAKLAVATALEATDSADAQHREIMARLDALKDVPS